MPGRRALVEAVLLGDDLMQREALLAGERKDVAPAVLSAAQARNEAPLPSYLVNEEGGAGRRIASDSLWEAYYRHTAAMAARRGSAMLARWVAHEVAMRNALATERAKALGLEASDYVVAEDLGEAGATFGALVSEWASAPIRWRDCACWTRRGGSGWWTTRGGSVSRMTR